MTTIQIFKHCCWKYLGFYFSLF